MVHNLHRLFSARSAVFAVLGALPFLLHLGPIFHRGTEPVTPRSVKPCGPCLSSRRLCSIYGSVNLQRSRLYEGSGERIRRVLRKARAGQGLSMSVLGGSISVGHGCEDGSPLWHDHLKAWAEGRFGGIVTLVNGAVPATGSEFFKFCHTALVPPDVDLVLIDTAVNDWSTDDVTFDNKEPLIRSLLLYNSPPALLVLDFFKIDNMMRSGADAALGLSNYYDFPTISMRPVYLPKMLLDREWRTQWYRGPYDPIHPNCQGHRAAADMVVAYLEDQLCQMDQPEYNVRPSSASHVPTYSVEQSLSVPRLRLHGPGPLNDVDSFDIPPTASCQFLHGNFTSPFEPVDREGFELWTMPNTDKRYWRGQGLGSYITFALDPTKAKTFLYFLRSGRQDLRLGAVRCTRGDKETLVDGWHQHLMNIGFSAELFPADGPLVQPTVRCTIVNETASPTQGDSFNIMGLIQV